MKINRRDFVKLGTLGTLGLTTIPNNVLNPVPMEISTHYGQLLFHTVKYHNLPIMPLKYWLGPSRNIPAEYSEHKTLMGLDKEFIRTKGMDFLNSHSRITDEQRMDVRDAEVVNRVMDQANLVEDWKDWYPSSWQWSIGDIRMDIFHYLVKELEKLNPKNDDFSEGYTKKLVRKLVAIIPNERFNLRINYYHDVELNQKTNYKPGQSSFLPGQINAPVIFDETGKKLNRNSKTTMELYCFR